MTDIELLRQALDALEDDDLPRYEIIKAIEARLAQPEQDDGYCQACDGDNCTAKKGCVALDNPPKKEWVGLTDADWIIGKRSADYIAGAEWAEAKLKEKNA